MGNLGPVALRRGRRQAGLRGKTGNLEMCPGCSRPGHPVRDRGMELFVLTMTSLPLGVSFGWAGHFPLVRSQVGVTYSRRGCVKVVRP